MPPSCPGSSTPTPRPSLAEACFRARKLSSASSLPRVQEERPKAQRQVPESRGAAEGVRVGSGRHCYTLLCSPGPVTGASRSYTRTRSADRLSCGLLLQLVLGPQRFSASSSFITRSGCPSLSSSTPAGLGCLLDDVACFVPVGSEPLVAIPLSGQGCCVIHLLLSPGTEKIFSECPESRSNPPCPYFLLIIKVIFFFFVACMRSPGEERSLD